MFLKPILLTTALVTAFAPQSTPAPPMKMGLWEYTSNITMSGGNIPAGMPPRVMKLQRCVTPETWAKNFQALGTVCERKNETLSGGHYTADFSCPSGSGHVDMNFTTPESGQGTVHMNITAGGGGMVADSAVTMHFVSASCGSVQPDRPMAVQ